MQQLDHASVLLALGYAIINSFWQLALLWLVYAAISFALKFSPHQKYVSAATAQMGGFMWFIFTFFKCFSQPADTTLTTNIFPSFLINFFPKDFSHSQVLMQLLLPYISVTYLIALIFFGAKWINAYRYAGSIKANHLSKINVEWRLFVQKLSAQMGIQKKVIIHLSTAISSPLTFGFLKPIILIPLACLNHLTAVQMEALIIHELAHIRRHDYFFNLFLSVAETILFFNPFMHFLGEQVKKERENCCDDWVLQFQYNPAIYAGALLAVASTKDTKSLALHASEKKVLLTRVKRILQQPPLFPVPIQTVLACNFYIPWTYNFKHQAC